MWSGRKRLAASWPQSSVAPPQQPTLYYSPCFWPYLSPAACNHGDGGCFRRVGDSEDANSTHSFINLDYSQLRVKAKIGENLFY